MDTKQLKVLLVDDDHFLLDMYSLKFRKSGIDIDPVGSSTTALEKLRVGGVYDILIFDIIMPTMNGLELLEKVKNEKLVPGAVIIMLTNQADDVQRARELGVDGYIIKATTIPSEVVEQVVTIYKNKKTTTS